MNEPSIETTDEGVRFNVKVSPRGSRDTVLGVLAGAIKVGLTASPVDGKANAALIAFLAKRLSVPKRNIQIVSGVTARIKTVVVSDVEPQAIRQLVE